MDHNGEMRTELCVKPTAEVARHRTRFLPVTYGFYDALRGPETFPAIDLPSSTEPLQNLIPMDVEVSWTAVHYRRRASPGIDARAAADENPVVENPQWRWWHGDIVDTRTVNLTDDEYDEPESPKILEDEEIREKRLQGKARWLWRAWYSII